MAITDTARQPRGPWHWGNMARAATRQTVPALLWTLHELGGHIEDPSGQCSRRLIEAAKERGYPIAPVHDSTLVRNAGSGGAMSQVFNELEVGRYAGCIARTINGKRTLRIDLLLDESELPPKPRPVVTRQVAPTAPPRPPAPAAAVEPNGDAPLRVANAAPVPEPVQPTLPPLTMVDSTAVDLLLQIQQLSVQATLACAADVGRTATPVLSEHDEAVAERLASTLEENNRLRTKVNDLAETMRAKAKENEALRKQIMLLQNNLRAIQEASANAPNVERNLARLRGNQQFIAARPEPAIAARR